MYALLRRPLAWIPLSLPVSMIAMLGYYLLLSNGQIVRESDEGTAAHLFQLWIPLQAVLVAWFALVWFPRAPRTAGIILALQIALSLIPITVVFYYNL